MAKKYRLEKGQSYPIGATCRDGGVNFSLFSKNATRVELLLFDQKDHTYPSQVFKLEPDQFRTFHYWHCFIKGLKPGQLYGYRVFGPFEPSKGLRFDGEKVLIDPYARALVTKTYNREAATAPGDNCAEAIKSVVIDPSDYDWEGDRPLNHPFEHSVIYELHVGGFTKDPSSGLSKELRGTYRGLIEKIPYLKSLGVTAVELMPVQQFDRADAPPGNINYWGYSQLAFFAPHCAFGATDDPVELVDEFRDMVKALHKAGIEVILDVVFNHTAEGNENGPTLSMRGIENRAYYILPENNQQYYSDFTGTGNTLNANHSVVRRLITDCLCHWVSEMHVDGFRFDLASVLARDERGHYLENPPLLWEIESEPQLASTKIIAEAWDTKGYLLGAFIGDKWAEWNGKFRDDVRSFVKGDPKVIRAMADRLVASPAVFGSVLRNPNRSINFITCHDGFTLQDLVSYNEKHNEANNENNRDGHGDNHSWNCGVEGPTNDPQIKALRKRQIKNFLAILMISQGTPMLLMGDEVRRSQNGNNNAYCQDNELSWFDWSALEREKEMLEYTKRLIHFNLSTHFFQEEKYWSLPGGIVLGWHGTRHHQPDWSDQSHCLAFELYDPEEDAYLHVMLNAFWEDKTFDLPGLPDGKCWRKVVDTAAAPPFDCIRPEDAPKVSGRSYKLKQRSVVVMMNC
ncbi:MAG: glycogen debranching protein GlgX [Bacteroidota bacterium]